MTERRRLFSSLNSGLNSKLEVTSRFGRERRTRGGDPFGVKLGPE